MSNLATSKRCCGSAKTESSLLLASGLATYMELSQQGPLEAPEQPCKGRIVIPISG